MKRLPWEVWVAIVAAVVLAPAWWLIDKYAVAAPKPIGLRPPRGVPVHPCYIVVNGKPCTVPGHVVSVTHPWWLWITLGVIAVSALVLLLRRRRASSPS